MRTLTGNLGFGSMRNTSNTVLLINSDTTDGSTTFTDSSSSGHTITANGNAQHDTAQKKFGASSMLFDGTGDYLTIPDHADWNLGTGIYTIDWWMRIAELPAEGEEQGIWGQYGDSTNSISCLLNKNGSFYYILFWVRTDGGSDSLRQAGWVTPVINQWYHIAWIKGWAGAAANSAVCIDGKKISGPYVGVTTMPDLSGTFDIGKAYFSADVENKYFNGHIDGLRIVKGETMWKSDFIPPAGPYS